VGSATVLVVVLTYNSGPGLEACLRSLQGTTYPAARIVVIDNGSTDGSVGVARRLGIEVHPFGENLGYCAAYNRAFREILRSEAFVLLSNPDLIVPPPTIERMVSAAGDDPGIGFVGPVQRHADTRDVRSAGIRWRCGHLPRHVVVAGEPFDALEGAFLLVRRSVIDRVGGLDEAFGLNLEDIEWQMRAAKAGFRSVLARDAEVFHDRPGSVRVTTGAYYQARNACLLTSRHCGRAALLRLKARLYAEGIGGRLLARPRGRFILQGLRDFRRGVTAMRRFP
jgi:N-acetylglucosaminyl-diphospho-decaprenol L-rhamnosyltransferase